MADENQNRRYVKIGVIGDGKKQTLRESIEKDFRKKSLKIDYMEDSDLDRIYRKFKQEKVIIDLADEPQGPQMD